MNITELLNELSDHHISLSLDGEDLSIAFEGDQIPELVVDKIRKNKSHLISYLKKYASQEVIADIYQVPQQDGYPMSFSQRRLWILSQYPEMSKAYVIPSYVNLTENLDIALFNKAVNAVIERHEILRTVFKEDETGTVKQYILPMDKLNFEVSILDFSLKKNAEALVKQYMEEDAFQEFDLEKAPLFRASLIKLSEQQYTFYYIMHHIISDGWSLDVLVKDVLIYYEAYKNNTSPDIAPLRIQYKDYANWHGLQLKEAKAKNDLNFWLKQFESGIPVLEIPSEQARPTIKTSNGALIESYLSKETTQKLKVYAQKQESSLFITLLSLWNSLLYRYTGQPETVIGTAVAGREHAYLEDQIGFYVNTLALKNTIAATDSFNDYHAKVKANTLDAFSHQIFPFDQLVEELKIIRDSSRSPLFDVMLTFQSVNTAAHPINLSADIVNRIHDKGKRNAKFDIEVNALEMGDWIQLTVNYNTDIYSPDMIKQLMSHFGQLADVILDAPDQHINTYDFLSQTEHDQLLYEFNNTKQDCPSDKTVMELFEAQVQAYPNRIAVFSEEGSMTYKQLNEKANRLGHFLRQQYTITADDLVGIELPRKLTLITAIFGVLKAGGAYVPIDPNNPQDRKSYIKQDAGCKCIVDEELLTRFESVAETFPITNPTKINDANSLIYVIYTSGSTGNPKGAMIENHALINRLVWMQKAYSLKEQDVILQKTTYSFDVSVWELLWWSMYGAKVYLLEPEAEKIPSKIVQSIQDGEITVMHFVPSMLSPFLQYLKQFPEEKAKLKSLKQVFTSGEALSKDHCVLLQEQLPWVALMNLYGPTEASIDVTYYDCSEVRADNIIPIGKPIDNTQMYILDERLKPVPIGVKGKLYIGGRGLARGYVNNETLTRKKFIAHPFQPGQFIYDTGDVAHWLKDGNINFLGRMDDQVKIRGFRIELGEIEYHLREKENVSEAVVLVKETAGGQKELVAFIVSVEKQSVADLRSHLAAKVPQYMIPSGFVQVDNIPLNASGKTDRRRLLASGQSELSNQIPYVAPQNEKERILVEICEAVLAKDKISVKDNFYNLGGDSIKSIQIVSRLKQAGYLLKVEEVLRTPVLESLAALLTVSTTDAMRNANPVVITDISFPGLSAEALAAFKANPQIEDVYELAPLQQGIYFHWLTSTSGSQYLGQISYRVHMNGIEMEAIKKAYQQLIDRHSILRTSFISDLADIPLQVVRKKVAANFLYDQVQVFQEEQLLEEYIKKYKQKDRDEGFDLTNHSLMRLKVLDIGANRYEFVWSHHHILMDGWCMAVLLQDFNQLLNAITQHTTVHLPEAKPFAHHIHWLRTIDTTASLNYWQTYLQGYSSIATIPFLRQKPQENYKEEVRSVIIKGELYGLLKELCNELEITQNTFLQTAWGILLSKYNNTNDVVFGSVVSGRPAELDGVESMIGLFINTIPLRIQYKAEDIRSQLLTTVQKANIDANAHHFLNLAKVQSQSELGADLINHLIVFQNFPLEQMVKDNMHASLETEKQLKVEKAEFFQQTNYDFNLLVFPSKTTLQIDFIFNADKYESTGVTALASHLYGVIEQLITAVNEPVSSINILSAEDHDLIFNKFNATEIAYEKGKTVLDLFRERVQEIPEQIAVAYKKDQLTYKQLDLITGQLAFYLQKHYAVQPNDLVGIKLERGLPMLISIMGIMRCGAAYIPIDTGYPEERINYIATDSGYKVCIDEPLFQKFKKGRKSQQQFKNLDLPVSTMAYAIYTSGSTGNPKGVLNDHAGLYNRLLWMRDDLGINEKEIILQKTPYTFDVSVWELIMPSITGCKLVFAKPDGHKDPLYLQEIIASEKITILHFVPSMLSIFLEELDTTKCTSLKHVVCSGEALSPTVVEEFKTKLPWVRIHNLYGPTEAAIDVTSIELTNVDTLKTGVTIGKAVANTRIFIVDKQLSLQPVGVPGELLIEGIQVARKYINQPELTAKKFIASPFHHTDRAYLTGDLAKWLPNGEIVYLGRMDHQVKIRGNRIELGEIETRIIEFPCVENAIVLVKEKASSPAYLVAYIIPKEGYDQNSLFNYLKNTLPDYMIPSVIVEMEEFPLTSSGKLNRKELPDAGENHLTAERYEAPRNELETALENIWKEVLEIKQVGIHDDFFRIGGDSILSIRLINKINRQFNTRLTIGQLYETSSILSLAELINNKVGISTETIKIKEEIITKMDQLKGRVLKEIQDPDTIDDIYPMSDIQRGMVLLSTLNPGTGMYHDQFLFHIPAIRLDLFKLAFSKLVWKHEALRTRFNLSKYGEEIQIVDKHVEVAVGYHDLKNMGTTEQEEHIKNFMLADRHKRPFDFEKSPMWYADVFCVSHKTDVFLFQFYHAILDGWSVASLNTELVKIYQQLLVDAGTFKLEKLQSAYRNAIIGELCEKNNTATINFWKEELLDYKRLDLFKHKPIMQNHMSEFEPEFIINLRKKCRQEGISMKTAFYGTLVYVFKILSNENDFVLGLVTNNRPIIEDGDHILGCFLNTIPVRNRLEDVHHLSWKEYFARVEHQLKSLRTKERMTLYEISKITNERNAFSSPFFDVLFNYVDFHVYNELENNNTMSEAAEKRLNVESYEATNTYLDIDVITTGKSVRLVSSLRNALKVDIPIAAVHNYVNKILNVFLTNSDERINTTNLLPAEEREMITSLFSNTHIRSNPDKTILDLINESVLKYPEKIALTENNKTLSYKQLDTCINQLANYLVKHSGMSKGDFIAVEMEPGSWTIIAMLAVMKAGGVYIPVNPGYPDKHKEYIYKDSHCKLILNDALITDFKNVKDNYKDQFTTVISNLDELAYIIYTSGSTGNPKGVQIKHASLADYAITFSSYFKLNDEDKIVQQASISFDTSIEEIFPILISGGTLVIFEGKKDIDQLLQLCVDYKISILSTNPFVLQHLNNVYKKYTFSFRALISGGDVLKPVYIDRIWTEVPIYNTYGPTESTVCATYHKVTSIEEPIPIGKPIANRYIHLLHPETLQLTAIGVTGEICISGKGITAGYLNRPELMIGKFIPNPYVDGAIMFRTGDMGRWLPDGNIEFIGRKDNQVKVRGYRIELGEIEATVLKSGLVKDNIVLVKGKDEESKRLVAYVIPQADYEQERLLRYLAQALPEYMIPSVIIEMEYFPLTLNGKPDKNILPEPNQQDHLADALELPRNETEEKLVQIWSSILNTTQIGTKSDFFKAGGTSLTVIKLRQKIEEQMAIPVNIVDLFNHPTIQEFASFISKEMNKVEENSMLAPETLKF